MALSKRPHRSILKRRGSISTAVQAVVDVVAVMTEQEAVPPEPRREEPPAPRGVLGQRIPD